MADSVDAKHRFSDRVAEYVRYRPSYPPEVVDLLADRTGLAPGWVVADVGSGTGLSCIPFLDRGLTVIGVEPNADMRRAAETFLAGRPGFRSLEGSAEATGLADRSVDLVVAGQAFHWFDRGAAREECLRVLRGPRWAALMWNIRDSESEGFGRAYEALLERFGTDYREVRAGWAEAGAMEEFFGRPPEEVRLPNDEHVDFDGLRGRHLSSSFVPRPGHASFEPMMAELRRVFDEHAIAYRVRIAQDTRVFVGRLA